MIRRSQRDGLARFLGWFSIGLGAAQVVAPRTMCKLIGADGDGGGATVMRLMGIRELTQGTGILTRPRPTGWMWSRVVGDALDLSLLGLVAVRSDKRMRTAFAIANVVAVTVPDVFEARHLAAKSGPAENANVMRKSVTIAKTREQVQEAWVAADELRSKVDARSADVSFLEAPGNRGTEVVVQWTEKTPIGELGVAFGKLTGRDLATQLSDDLRRFKSLLETGQVVRSDSTPTGHSLGGHLKQRAARPLEAVAA
jgi:uncharacterized membrane protein